MITHIVDNIFIGDWADAERYQKDFETFTLAKESKFVGDHFYPLVDNEDDANEYLLSSAIGYIIIKRCNTNHKMLVHCKYGQSRSVAAVLGYMIFYKGCSFDDAYRHIKNCKRNDNDITLNPYFKKLLWDIEKSGKLYKSPELLNTECPKLKIGSFFIGQTYFHV